VAKKGSARKQRYNRFFIVRCGQVEFYAS